MDEQLCRRCRLDSLAELLTRDAGVDMALSEPHVEVCPTGLASDMRTEELVGKEQDLAVGGDRRNDLDGVRRRAADVGLCLDLGRCVDVRDHGGAGMLGLPAAKLLGRDAVRQRAAGGGIGQEDGPVRGQDLRRLGHECDAGEDDDRGVARRRQPGERQRVADVVSGCLDLWRRVVVRKDHRRPTVAQAMDLVEPTVEGLSIDASLDASLGGARTE